MIHKFVLCTNIKSFELMLAALGQNDFTSLGPVGATSLLEQNAVIPNLHMQLRYVNDAILLGAAFDFDYVFLVLLPTIM